MDITKESTTLGDRNLRIVESDASQFMGSMQAGSVDLIVTDPAYSGMNNHLSLGRGRIVGNYAEKGKGSNKWFEEFSDNEESYRKFLENCHTALAPHGHLYIMFDSYSLLSLGPLLRELFSVKNIISWDKVNIGMGHYYRRRHEFVIFATKQNNRNISSRSFPDVWRIKRIHRAHYPTQKPVELFDIMLSASSKPGFTVCDPFIGSGSSAVSAIKYGCNFFGCDISEKAVNFAQKRAEAFIETGVDPYQAVSGLPNGEKKFW